MSWIDNLHSANWNQAGSVCLSAYALGCFTAGYYLVRIFADKDIRETGSGSVGARNVSRVLGRGGFFLTALIDSGKGALAVWATKHFSTDIGLIGLAMLAVVAGHIWPAQLRLRGGKGMATTLGALLVYDPQLAATFAVLFVCLAAAFRRVTLPAMCALICLPVAGMLLDYNPARVVVVSILSALVILAHRKNLVEAFVHFMARRHLDPKPDESQL